MFSDSVSVTTVVGCLRTKGLKGRTQKAGLHSVPTCESHGKRLLFNAD